MSGDVEGKVREVLRVRGEMDRWWRALWVIVRMLVFTHSWGLWRVLSSEVDVIHPAF